MKVNLLIALLLICGIANAQTLKLKKDQKFSYEAINEVELNDEFKNTHYGYWQSNLVVTGQSKDTYTLKVSPSIILTKWGEGILDSTVPFEEQPTAFMAITNKVLTLSSFDMTVDRNGTIISTTGLSEIRSEIATKLKDLKIPEDYQKHTELLNQICTEAFFTRFGDVFKDKGSLGNRDPKSGLLVTCSTDTTEKKFSPEGVLISSPHTSKKSSLIHSSSQPLLTEAKEKLNYADYYLPIAKISRKIDELGQLFQRNKGSQTIEALILKKLDTLDLGFAKDDYQYLGAKLRVLTYLNGGDYTGILHKVPYEYLPGENDIDNKLSYDLKNGDISNVKKAIELTFTKFKGNFYYPMNMANTSESIHNNFGGLIFRMQNKDSLQKAYKIITDLEELKNSVISNMIKGMKTYVQAKLATGQKELAEIANTHFNTIYDMGGRATGY